MVKAAVLLMLLKVRPLRSICPGKRRTLGGAPGSVAPSAALGGPGCGRGGRTYPSISL